MHHAFTLLPTNAHFYCWMMVGASDVLETADGLFRQTQGADTSSSHARRQNGEVSCACSCSVIYVMRNSQPACQRS